MHEFVTQLLSVVAVLAPYAAGGAVVPFLVSLITESRASVKAKQVLMIALSAAVAVVLYLNDNGWQIHSASDALAAVIMVVTSAQSAYHGLWKRSGLTDAVSKLTDRTTATAKDVLSPAVIPAGVVPALPEDNGGVDADEAVPAVAPRRAALPVPVAPAPEPVVAPVAPAAPSAEVSEAAVTVAAKRLPDGPYFG